MLEQPDAEAFFAEKLQAQSTFFRVAHRIHHGETHELPIEEFDTALERIRALFPRVNTDLLRKLKEESSAARVATELDITPRGASAIAEYLDALDQLGFGPVEKGMLDFGRERYLWELTEREFE